MAGIFPRALIAAAALVFATNAHAALVTNGTFDTDLSGWSTTGSSVPTSWITQTAHIGRPGTPGTSIFFQDFDIAFGTTALEVKFDYEWQVNAPVIEDFFTADLIYQTNTVETVVSLVNEGSESVTFGSTTAFSTIVSLFDLANIGNNGRIRFQLIENNASAGTRIQLDNVSVTAVPLPAALPLFAGGLGLMGLLGWRRKRKATAAA